MIDDILVSKTLNINITQAKRKKSFLQMINKADTLIKLKDTQSIEQYTQSISRDIWLRYFAGFSMSRDTKSMDGDTFLRYFAVKSIS